MSVFDKFGVGDPRSSRTRVIRIEDREELKRRYDTGEYPYLMEITNWEDPQRVFNPRLRLDSDAHPFPEGKGPMIIGPPCTLIVEEALTHPKPLIDFYSPERANSVAYSVLNESPELFGWEDGRFGFSSTPGGIVRLGRKRDKAPKKVCFKICSAQYYFVSEELLEEIKNMQI